MIILQFKFEFLDYWGSPLPGAGNGPDNICFRDARGLPALDGDTIKGLFRDASNDLENLGQLPAGTTSNLFGTRGTGHREQKGTLQFASATLSEDDALFALQYGKDLLFKVIHQTSLSNGVARDKSLRSSEWAVPCTLETNVTGPDDTAWITALVEASYLIRHIGAHRHRGYGRVQVARVGQQSRLTNPVDQPSADTEGPVWLQVELLSRTLLSSASQTIGQLESLDHIPGSALRGAAIAVGGFSTDLLTQVSISPAYPLNRDGLLGIPCPLLWSRVDNQGLSRLVSHTSDESVDIQTKPTPLKGGFFHQLNRPTESTSVAIHRTARSYSPKSARNPEQFDRTADGQFFALNRLEAGQRFAFVVCGPLAHELVRRLMTPDLHLGRRRNSGNGKVRITRLPAPPTLPQRDDRHPTRIRLFVWSDIALYRNGLTTFSLRPSDFYLPDDTVWQPAKSALRTRSYSPWNHFHGGTEGERHVICRGSVLTFDTTPSMQSRDELAQKLWKGVGAFTDEGLGRVLLDPTFLDKPSLTETSAATAALNTPTEPKHLGPTNAWQRWLANQPTPEAELQLRSRALAYADRLQQLVGQLAKQHCALPTAAQYRSLAQRIQDAAAGALLPGIIQSFCAPEATAGDRHRSIRSPMWTHPLMENHRATNLLQVLIEFVSEPGFSRRSLHHALLILAAEAARSKSIATSLTLQAE